MSSNLLPTFESPRLIFRPYVDHDRAFFVELLTDPNAMQFTGGPMSPEQAVALFQCLLRSTRGSELEAWIVISKTNGRPVGHVALKSDGSNGDREIIVVLTVRQWRKGFAFETSRVLFEYALATRGYPKLIATVDPNHTASVGLVYKSGMTLLEHREDGEGRYPVYAITREQWLTSKGN